MGYFFEKRNDGIFIHSRETIDFKEHLHNHLELDYIESGKAEAYIDEVRYDVKAGNILLIFPNQIHSFRNSVDVECKYIIFSADTIPEFEKLFCENLPINPLVPSCGKDCVELIKMMYENNISSSPEILRGLLLATVGMLLSKMKLKPLNKYNISTLKNILIYCDEHYKDPITLDNLAKALHISRSRISHIFKEKLGTTFTDYISKKRIEYACSLLQTGRTNVTEAAFASGFGSIRTFNRVFSNQMGISPQKYKKRG